MKNTRFWRRYLGIHRITKSQEIPWYFLLCNTNSRLLLPITVYFHPHKMLLLPFSYLMPRGSVFLLLTFPVPLEHHYIGPAKIRENP